MTAAATPARQGWRFAKPPYLGKRPVARPELQLMVDT